MTLCGSKNSHLRDAQLLATRADIAEVNARIRETELRLQKEIQQVKYDLLKWQIGGWLGMVAIMAKGFGWLGF